MFAFANPKAASGSIAGGHIGVEHPTTSEERPPGQQEAEIGMKPETCSKDARTESNRREARGEVGAACAKRRVQGNAWKTGRSSLRPAHRFCRRQWEIPLPEGAPESDVGARSVGAPAEARSARHHVRSD